MCYEPLLKWGRLLGRELSDGNELVGPSSVLRVPGHESFFCDRQHVPTTQPTTSGTAIRRAYPRVQFDAT